jgi:hypothetical protein
LIIDNRLGPWLNGEGYAQKTIACFSLKGVAYGSLGKLIVQNLVAVSNFTS